MSELLRKKLNKHDGSINLICIIREPISREISAFFQNTEFYKNTIESSNLEIDIEKAIVLLKRHFEKNIISGLDNWFLNEIQAPFGIDIYNDSFDSEKGYKIYHNGNYKLLLLKMEMMDRVFSKAIKELLNINQEIKLINSNISENKHYAADYSKAKIRIRLKKEQVKAIVNSVFFQKFYPELKEDVRNKWEI